MTEPLPASFIFWHWLILGTVLLAVRWLLERLCRRVENRRGY